MLDPAGRFELAELPNVIIFPDLAAPARFYAIPASPRVALDAHGQPQISLLIYGKRQGTAFEPSGGQLTLTTNLELTSREQETLRRALAARLPHTAGTPEIASPDWLEGAVEVRLPGNVHLAGTPSMIGANQCVMMASLSADQAKALEAAWANGLPDATICYRVQTNAATHSAAAAESSGARSSVQPGYSDQSSHSAGIHVSATQAVRYPLTIEGPLTLARDQLANQIQVIGL
jgi:hypothetical protein